MSRLVIPSHTQDIVLHEPVNREVLTWLIGNPSMVDACDNTKDKILYGQLIGYAQRLKLDDTVMVTYRQQSYSCGRMYADGYSIQKMTKKLRHPLAHGQCFDTDMVNCHPVILLFLATAHGLECTNLRDYVENREQRLESLMQRCSATRSEMKDTFLSIMNGGELSHSDYYLENLKVEMIPLTEALLTIYPEYCYMKSDGTAGTPLALLMQDCENWCLQIVLPLVKDCGVSVLSYDGLMSRTQPDASLLERCSEAIAETVTLNGHHLHMQFINKPVLPPCEEWKYSDGLFHWTWFESDAKETVARVYSSYQQVKERFEVNTFALKKPAGIATVSPTSDNDNSDRLVLTTVHKLKENLSNLYFYNLYHEPARPKLLGEDEDGNPSKKRKSRGKDADAKDGDKMVPAKTSVSKSAFIPEWLLDEERRCFNRVDYMPPPLRCPEGVYNLWTGFAVEALTCTDDDRREMQEWIIPFLRDVICSANAAVYRYLIMFLAQLFQQPGLKINIALVLLGIEGAGKNTLTTLQQLMIGKTQCLQTAVLKDKVLGRFACSSENRVLGVLDEICPQEMRLYQRALMDLITSPTTLCEKKGVSGTYDTTNLLRLIFSTNDMSRFRKVPERDRKYQFIECSPCKVGLVHEYFTPLRARINSPGVRRAFYEYLLTIDFSEFNFETERVQTELYTDSKLQSSARELQWLRHWVLSDGAVDNVVHEAVDALPRQTLVGTTDLFKQFERWVSSENGGMGKCNSYSTTPIGFGVVLKSTPGFVKNKRHGAAASHILEPKVLVEHLQKIGLLVQTEVDWLLGADRMPFDCYCERLDKQDAKKESG
jgi:hypothetical protein